MVSALYEQVISLVEKLDEAEKDALRDYLLRRDRGPVTREMILADHKLRKASGAFDKATSLHGKFANPTAPDVGQEEINEYLRQIGREWEEELDEGFVSGKGLLHVHPRP